MNRRRISVKARSILCSIALGMAVFQWGPVLAEQGEVTNQALYLKTTSDMATVCSTGADYSMHKEAEAFCIGFITGTMHFYGALVPKLKKGPVICSDHEISRIEIREVFLKWFKKHPEHSGDAPIDGLLRAAAAKWPCEK